MLNAATKKIKSALKNRQRPSRRLIISAVLALILVFVTLFLVNQFLKNEDQELKNAIELQNSLSTTKLTIGDTQFAVELARSEAEKTKGLSGRDQLAPGTGMLFVYDNPGDYQFWMKDTRINLDMIWIDANKQIVHIEQNVKPESYPQTFGSNAPAQYILEISGGEAAKRGIKPGSHVQFTL